ARHADSDAAIFAPDRMLVGGGLSELGQPFYNGVLEGLQHVGMPYSVQGIPVIRASPTPNGPPWLTRRASWLSGSLGQAR
ncbi:MAG: hypothetical protein M1602_01810, partial [Firmicutes bacterium]|nr:hypothetical protein [Bacillota bacterium]